MDAPLQKAITEGCDFIQIKNGPFDLDIVHAPDGIKDYASARARRIGHENYPVASLGDIIASKEASNRPKDLVEIPLLKAFKQEYERAHRRELKTAINIIRRPPPPYRGKAGSRGLEPGNE